jgi:hypothetical protein
MNKENQIEDALEELIKLGVLKKDKKGYIDTRYSKEIDTMSSREAFIEGVKKARKETLIEVEKMIDEIKNPYPTDIFPEITSKSFKEIQEVLNEKFLGFPFDRISANLMRRARINFKEELKQQLKNLEEK